MLTRVWLLLLEHLQEADKKAKEKAKRERAAAKKEKVGSMTGQAPVHAAACI